jgi:hypothetical protein
MGWQKNLQQKKDAREDTSQGIYIHPTSFQLVGLSR